MSARGKKTSGEKLRELAAPLKPAKAPFYVRERPPTLAKTYPADGWYWIPQGHSFPIWLAKSYDEARDVVMELLRREDREAELAEAS